MDLTNCYSREEKLLRAIELKDLSKKELANLARSIKNNFENNALGDEEIVISALVL